MPHQSRGFWCCDNCKLPFDSLEEAKQHEDRECQQIPSSKPQLEQKQAPSGDQQQQQSQPLPAQLPQHQQLQQHQQQQFQPFFHPQRIPPPQFAGYYPPPMAPVPNSAAATTAIKQETGGNYEPPPPAVSRKTFPLMGLNESSHMNPDDSVACQSLEVFEASQREVSDEELRSQYAGLAMGQLGLRCIHCSNNPQPSLSDATYFPASATGVESMADGVRFLSERHLRKCNMAPASVRDINQQATEKRRSNNQERGSSWQDDERSRSALRSWCFRFCQRLGIVDKGPNGRGLVFIQQQQGDIIGGPLARQRPMMGDPLAPTPMARRRPHDSGEYRPGYESYGGGGEGYYMTTQDAPGSMSGQSPHRGYQQQQQQQMAPFDMTGGFPFFQEAVGSWACKYCNHVPPPYRDPQSTWSAPNHMPPPPQYVDQHLNMCRAYHQSLQNQPIFQAGPPRFAFGTPQQQFPGGFGGGGGGQGWEAQGQGQGSQVQPMPFAYPQGGGNQDSNTVASSQRSFPPTPHQMPGATASADFGDAPSRIPQARAPIPSGASLRPDASSAVQRAIDYLATADREAAFAAGIAPGDDTDQLVLEEDKLLLTDYFFYLMKQLRLCRFSESDRKTRGGKREKILIGFGGLQCIHCSDANNSRKFFWSNVDRLANSFAEIPGHILKCRHCPQQCKDALYQLKQLHPEQMARLPRGSQKVFFRRMWRRLHDEDPQAASPEQSTPRQPAAAESISAASLDTKFPAASAKPSGNDTSPSGTSGSEESILLLQRSTKEAAKALADFFSMTFPPSPTSRVLLAIPEDKEWLSDTDCFTRRQIEVFCATRDDVDVARNDRKFPVHEGQVGIRCLHCALAKQGVGARGSGVAYPFSVSGIYESVREFQRLHLDSCENLPEDLKAKLGDLKGSTSLSSVLRKYYVLAAKALGLKDTRDGIRAGADSVPIGSQAAFAFSDSGGGGGGSSNINDEMRRSMSNPRSFASRSGSPSSAVTPVESRKRKSQHETPDGSEFKRPHSS